MEPQQLATKVAQLESRVATLEDEGKIVKGEVKQILTEIRSVILVRDNPFEQESLLPARSQPVTVVAAPQPEPPAARPQPAPQPPPAPDPMPRTEEHEREPIPLRPYAAVPPAPQPEQPGWSLLTIAGLSAWAEEAMRRLGALRLEILLDLCEAAGHLTKETRAALERVTEMDIAEPASPPTTNETVVILRQLDALVNDDEEYGDQRLQRRF